jgi:ATP-binding cassette subfamily F protein 3
MIRLLLEPVNLLILDEPTNHLDMASKDVLKEAIRAFDGTAIIVSHDREFLDGVVTKVYEFGGGKVREHLGGIYDFLSVRGGSFEAPVVKEAVAQIEQKAREQSVQTSNQTYAERKEQQKRIRKAERVVEECEKKIARMEQRLKELDALLMEQANASDMMLVTEYTQTKAALDEEVERWEKLSEELDKMEK